MDLEKSIEQIILSSDDEDIVCIDLEKEIKTNLKIKRELSSCFINQEEDRKKLKLDKNRIEEQSINNCNDKAESLYFINNKEKNFSLDEFWAHDPRCDKRLFYNRIDDDCFSINLYVRCLLDIILDGICENSYLYTLEHYYHQRYKKDVVLSNIERHQKLMSEFSQVFENKENLEITGINSSKTLMLKTLNHSKKTCNESYEEFKEFQRFIDVLYANKKILS
ncbi:unnamed protein product [Brachionus calyciflorus]|uniref:Uncharacterized protein n=1 Tax=Brachionus calyciflorus TaxID=104777 RepID=A0A814H1N7_9BILA|nr:unnamed protein product [Brachionus calyciflorus]